jgi:hypothetical protein
MYPNDRRKFNVILIGMMLFAERCAYCGDSECSARFG